MSGLPVPLRAVALPWLRPTDAALFALTADPPDRSVVLDDPGAVLLALRYARPTPAAGSLAFSPDLLSQPGLCAAAAAFLQANSTDPPPPSDALLRHARSAARIAFSLAERSGLCTPDAAWAAGLLAPLGWYAVAATGEHAPPADLTAVGRRLAIRWRLPAAFALTIGHPGVHPDDVASLGGHAGLHRVTRAAVAEADRRLGPLGLLPHPVSDPDLAGMAAEGSDLTPRPSEPFAAISPPVLARLLRASAGARQRAGAAVVAELERQVDRMTELLTAQRLGYETAVRDAKLTALAEFAAGASHEINNPLAIISGNAQLLLAGEPDPDRQRRLAGTVRAVKRVHDILVGTRQFARPPEPQPTAVAVGDLIRTELDAQRAFAEDHGVTITLQEGTPEERVRVDPAQARQVIGNLVRNAVEATPPGGWARVAVESRAGVVQVTVEDSGPGPAAEDVRHLFDPFFCGRSAGRGRGLGLSVAWRLARQNGGDVAYTPSPGAPSKFTFTLPAASNELSPVTAATERRSA